MLIAAFASRVINTVCLSVGITYSEPLAQVEHCIVQLVHTYKRCKDLPSFDLYLVKSSLQSQHFLLVRNLLMEITYISYYRRLRLIPAVRSQDRSSQ